MAQSDPSTRLSEAIALANAGQREQARALLLDLTRQYPDLELGWMWLAAVSDDSEERIGHLRRVLSINPANEKARGALTRLTGSAPESPKSSAVPPPVVNPTLTRSSSDTLVVIGLVMVIATVVVAISAILINQRNAQVAVPTASNTPTSTSSPTLKYTLTPSNTPGGPTETPISPKTLPPTWTNEPSQTPPSTFTAMPTNTDVPTVTPVTTVTPLSTNTALPTLAPLPTSTPRSDSF